MGEPTTYFKIDRSLLSSELWLSEPFTKAQAWIDLIGRANYSETQHFYGSKVVTLKRGQLITSTNALAQRWGWNRKKVVNFLKALETAKMVTAEGSAEGTTLTIENYDKFQLSGTTKGSAEGTSRGQAGVKQGSHYNNKYKDIQEKKEYIYTKPVENSPVENLECYGNLYLTPSQYDTLEEMCGPWTIDYIDRVNDWLEDHPIPKENHFAVLKKFVENDR